MYLTGLKEYCAGLGVVSINGQPISLRPAGSAHPLNDETIVFLANPGVRAIYQVTRPWTAPPTVFDPRGLSDLWAGGNRYMSTLLEQPPATIGTIPSAYHDWVGLDVGRDGSMALCPADGSQIACLWADGTTSRIPGTEHVNRPSVRVLEGRYLSFCYGNPPRLYRYSAATNQVTAVSWVLGTGQYNPLQWQHQGVWWAFYFSDEYGRVIHSEADPSHGYQWRGLPSYGADARVFPDGSARVVWALDEAESPNQLVVQDLLVFGAGQSVLRSYVAPPKPPIVSLSTGGALFMTTITGVLQHRGLNRLPNGKVTLIANANGDVWSVQPNGTLQTRVKGTDGGYEAGVLDGQIWSVNPGTIYTFIVCSVVGL